jgi:hypothetical protein
MHVLYLLSEIVCRGLGLARSGRAAARIGFHMFFWKKRLGKKRKQ